MADLKYTLTQRLERARELRAEGHVCSQCVMMCFPDVHSLTDRQAASLVIGLGGGVGGQGDICGCVSAMAMLSGFTSDGDPKTKVQTYGGVRALCQQFVQENGSLQCRELKTVGRKPCMQLIESAVTIFHNKLEDNQ